MKKLLTLLMVCAYVAISAVSVAAEESSISEDPFCGIEVTKEDQVVLTEAGSKSDMPIDVVINDKFLASEVRMHEGDIYVSLKALLGALNAGDVTFNSERYRAEAVGDQVEAFFPINRKDILWNGQILDMPGPTVVQDGVTWVPLRFVAELLGVSIHWDKTFYMVVLRSPNAVNTEYLGQRSYTYNEVQVFSRLVMKEAGGESYEAMHGVASVVMNRVKSRTFDNTVYNTIYDTKGTVQFPPAHDDKFATTVPNFNSVRAVKKVLRGENSVGTSLYFNTRPFKGKSIYKVVDGVYFCY